MLKEYHSQTSKKIIVKEKGKISQIDVANITHFLCDNYVTTVYLKNISNKYTTSKSLIDIESHLKDYEFFRINRSCIVNLQNVLSLISCSRTVILYGDIKLPVSRRNFVELKKHLVF